MDIFECHNEPAMDFQKFGGTQGVPRNYFAAKDRKSVLISMYLALRGSYVLQSAQNSLITLTIGPLDSPNSIMGCYIKIGPILAKKWRIDGDRGRIFDLLGKFMTL